MGKVKTMTKVSAFEELWEVEQKRRKESRRTGKTCDTCGRVVDTNTEEYCPRCRTCEACCACHY